MLIIRDSNHGDYEIKSYEPGKVNVNDKIYQESLLVSASNLETWKPRTIKVLTIDDLKLILAFKPDVVLLGTGEELIFPDHTYLQLFYDAGIGIEVMTTLAACRTFNVLMAEGRNVVAALLIC